MNWAMARNRYNATAIFGTSGNRPICCWPKPAACPIAQVCTVKLRWLPARITGFRIAPRVTTFPSSLLEKRAQAAEDRMEQLDLGLQRLRRANTELSDACAALLDANAEGVGDAHLINKAMRSELEALRAARAAEVSQADTLMAKLTPLLEAAAQTEGRA